MGCNTLLLTFIFTVPVVLADLESYRGGKRCGRATVEDNRIMYGRPSTKGEHPWIVSLEMRDKQGDWEHQCAGTIVHRNWILTAAHCFKLTDDPSRWRVVAGQYDRNVLECSEQRLNAAVILTHPDYDPPLNGHLNDIAMILLDGGFSISGMWVRTVCKPDERVSFPPGTECLIAGWGQEFYTIDDPADRKKLLEYNSTILDQKTCQEASNDIERKYGDPVEDIVDEMVCIKSEYDAAEDWGTGGICGGDSGGPLICKHNGVYYIAGVTSWSLRRPCGMTHDVFTRIQPYISWINKVISTEKSARKKPAKPDWETCQ